MHREGQADHFVYALRALAVIMAVLVGAGTYAGVTEAGAYRPIIHPLHAVALPLLFACDGFALAASRQRSLIQGGYLLRSARELLLPWIVFGVLYAALRAAFEYQGYLDERVVLGAGTGKLLHMLYSSAPAPQLSFLPALFLIRLLAPAVPWLMARPRPYAIGAMFACIAEYSLLQAPLAALTGPNDPFLYAAWGLPFYFAGVAAARCREELLNHWKPLAIVLGTFYLAGQFPGMMVAPGRFYQMVQLFAILIPVMALLNRPGLLPSVGRYATAVYVLYAPILLKAGFMVFSRLIDERILLWLVTAAAAFTAALAATLLLHRFQATGVLLGLEPKPG